MSQPKPPRSIHLLWGAVFGIWALLLSGTLASTVGSPGALQLFRLTRLLESKRVQQAELEAAVERLETESARLEKSRAAQEREIRRVLGYTAPDELTFDFQAAR